MQAASEASFSTSEWRVASLMLVLNKVEAPLSRLPNFCFFSNLSALTGESALFLDPYTRDNLAKATTGARTQAHKRVSSC